MRGKAVTSRDLPVFTFICMAYYLLKDGQAEYKTSGIQCLANAVKENMGIRWLPGLSEKLFFAKSEDVKDADFFVDCIEKIESVFTSMPTLQKIEKKIESILRDLNSPNGNEFERGHKAWIVEHEKRITK